MTFLDRIRPALRWTFRGLGILLILGGAGWTVLSLVSSSRLESAQRDFRADASLKDPLTTSAGSVLPEDNGAPYFAASFALLEGLKSARGYLILNSKGWAGTFEVDRERARAFLESAREAFEMAERGARKPRCVFVRKAFANRWRIALPELSPASAMVHALAARARMYGIEGNPGEARRSIALAFSVADCFREDACLPTQVVRASLHEIVCRAIPEALGNQPSAVELEEWIKVVPPPERLEGSLDLALRGDAFTVADNLSGSMGEFWESMEYLPLDVSPSYLRRLCDPWARFNGAEALDRARSMIALSRGPRLEAWRVAQGLRVEVAKKKDFASALTRNWCNALLTFEAKKAALLVTRAGLAFEKIRVETGKYPERCEITDPFTGKPLILDVDPGRLSTETPGPLGPMTAYRGFTWNLLLK